LYAIYFLIKSSSPSAFPSLPFTLLPFLFPPLCKHHIKADPHEEYSRISSEAYNPVEIFGSVSFLVSPKSDFPIKDSQELVQSDAKINETQQVSEVSKKH
jgi:hypothetical protein